ncbi:ABC transporter ATP-binding protein [Bacillus sp. FJAT-45037]|uniref:ABC transporter ATP-binding protein n=1 Tax=Bacillus sp. FJAT-45037 TaxID=2011007 RepID=UPI000C243556|nr:ABC transporter ATP-binding protein [Bacillus sp. FJAT-45037]
MIKLSNIIKSFGDEKGDTSSIVLKNINMEISRNTYSAIMVPSGSGKTTLLNILGCLDAPTEGSYEFNGIDITSLSEKELATLRNISIGFVFQHFHLLMRLTAIENVELPLIYSGISLQERKKKAEEALFRVGLESRTKYLPHELSGGQNQRVAIARSVINRPNLILADEPTGALDTKSSETIMDLFSELHHEGVAIVLITHDKNIAMKSNLIFHLLDGGINEVERVNNNVFT